MTISPRKAALGAALAAVLAVAGCGDSELGQATTYEQGKYKGKRDTRPYENDPSAFSNGSNWNKGDKTTWEAAIKKRQQSQNEYNRAE